MYGIFLDCPNISEESLKFIIGSNMVNVLLLHPKAYKRLSDKFLLESRLGGVTIQAYEKITNE